MKNNAPDLPEKLKNELDNTTKNLQEYIDGKNVPLYYTNYYYNNIRGNFNGFVTTGSSAYIKIPLANKTNGKVYQKKFNKVKITIDIDKTGAENISKIGSDYKTLEFIGASDKKTYELQPIIGKKTVNSVLPSKFYTDTYYYIYFPNIDGVTYSYITYTN